MFIKFCVLSSILYLTKRATKHMKSATVKHRGLLFNRQTKELHINSTQKMSFDRCIETALPQYESEINHSAAAAAVVLSCNTHQ